MQDLSIKGELEDYKIIYNLSNKIIISQIEAKKESDLLIDAYPVSDNVSEAHFIFYKISEYISSGISPEHIVVVLPKEDFSNKLRAFDKENNLNFIPSSFILLIK